jgi:hypothetical protein
LKINLTAVRVAEKGGFKILNNFIYAAEIAAA